MSVRRRASPPRELDRDLQAFGGRGVGEAIQPLDRDRGAIEGVGQAQLGQLARVLDAVEIGVHQRHAAGVLVDQRERRAGDVALGRHAQPARQPLHERRLAGAQRPDQRQDVAGGQQSAQALADRLRVGGGRRGEDQRVAHGVRA